MAIISSTAIGAGRKTAGELTYRHTRGRTIASRRISANKSNTRRQKEQRTAFAEVAAIAKSLAPWIELAFPKTKYGSTRNNFVKSNNNLMQQIKQQAEEVENEFTPVGYLGEAIERGKNNGLKVTGGKGNGSLNYTVEQTPEGLTYKLVSSRRIETGDTVRLLVALAYTTESFSEQPFETVNIYQYTVTPEKAQTLTDPYHITITPEEIPQLGDITTVLPPDYTIWHMVTAATIEQEGKATNTTLTRFPYVFPVRMNVTAQHIFMGQKHMTVELNNPGPLDTIDILTDDLIGCEVTGITGQTYIVHSIQKTGIFPVGLNIQPNNDRDVPGYTDDNIVESYVLKNGLKCIQLIGLKDVVHAM